jgi:hypothetical protein
VTWRRARCVRGARVSVAGHRLVCDAHKRFSAPRAARLEPRFAAPLAAPAAVSFTLLPMRRATSPILPLSSNGGGRPAPPRSAASSSPAA